LRDVNEEETVVSVGINGEAEFNGEESGIIER
jgi:hypothetical protein